MDSPFTKRHLRGLAAVAAIAAMLVSGCTGEAEEPPDTNAGPPDQVTYWTGFGLFGREAPVFVAIEKGYFAEENIEVTVEPGRGTIDNTTAVVEGTADFALVDLTGALLAYGQEAVPVGSTVVAAVQQQTVFSIMALESSGIRTPKDLEGKHVGDAAGSFGPLLWPVYADLAGIDASEVNMDNTYQPQDLFGLVNGGQVDAIGQFLVGAATLEAIAGEPAVVLPFSDVLRDLYGVGVVTSTETASQDPDLVQRFNRAFFRGLADAIANPEEAAQIHVQHVPEQNPDAVAGELRLMAPYVQPLNPAAPLGSLDEQRVAQSIALLEGAGVIPEGIVPTDIFSFQLAPRAEG
jgi:NitT/TauT family transport system substrate-binding protein